MIDREQVQIPRAAVAAPGLLDHGRDAMRAVTRFSKSKPLGAIGGAIVVALVFVAIFAGQITTLDPRDVFVESVHTAPGSEFWLGTDHIGRDLFSRMVYGARISLYVGLGSVLIGITLGFVIGVGTTYIGGKLDMVIQRFVDALMSLPGLIIALAIIAVLGSSLNNVIIAIVIGLLAPVIRTVRSQVLSLKELDYVLAARAVGATGTRIVFRHIAPNCFATYLILASYYLGFAIIIEASLSFLGVGAPPDVPSWGGILTQATREHVKTAPWVGLFPGMTIFVVVLGFNLLGDALRDVFDPKLRGR